MREFFKECIKMLDTVAGIKKYTYLQISAGKSEEARIEAAREMDLWIDSLVRVSQRFDYIPEVDQKKYITRMMEEDQKYQEFNSRTVWGWLEMHKDKHMTHSQFTESDLSQGKYFDELSPDIQALVNKFVQDLSEAKKVPAMTAQQIEEEGQEKEKKRGAVYTSTTVEDVRERELRAEYGRTYCDAYSGKTYPGAPSWEEFISLQKKIV